MTCAKNSEASGQEIIDRRRTVDDRPVLMRLAIQYAQRIAVQPGLAVLAQRSGVRVEMFEKSIAPRRPRLRIAKRIELEDRAFDAQLLEKLVGESEISTSACGSPAPMISASS